MSSHPFKADAVLQAIREADVGDDVIIHNEHGMVWCIVRVMSKEHHEQVEVQRNSNNSQEGIREMKKNRKVVLSGELCVSCKRVKLDKKGGIRPYICQTCADVIKLMIKNGCMVQ